MWNIQGDAFQSIDSSESCGIAIFWWAPVFMIFLYVRVFLSSVSVCGLLFLHVRQVPSSIETISCRRPNSFVLTNILSLSCVNSANNRRYTQLAKCLSVMICDQYSRNQRRQPSKTELNCFVWPFDRQPFRTVALCHVGEYSRQRTRIVNLSNSCIRPLQKYLRSSIDLFRSDKTPNK